MFCLYTSLAWSSGSVPFWWLLQSVHQNVQRKIIRGSCRTRVVYWYRKWFRGIQNKKTPHNKKIPLSLLGGVGRQSRRGSCSAPKQRENKRKISHRRRRFFKESPGSTNNVGGGYSYLNTPVSHGLRCLVCCPPFPNILPRCPVVGVTLVNGPVRTVAIFMMTSFQHFLAKLEVYSSYSNNYYRTRWARFTHIEYSHPSCK